MQPSWGEPLWELQDVRALVDPNLTALLFSLYIMLAALLTTTMPLFLLVQKPSRLSDVHSRWKKRRNISRDSGVGVSLSVSYLPLPHAVLRLHMPLSHLSILADQSSFPHHLGGC